MLEKSSPHPKTLFESPYGRQAYEIALAVSMIRKGQNREQPPYSRARWLIESALESTETEV